MEVRAARLRSMDVIGVAIQSGWRTKFDPDAIAIAS
jgi:hypothetical protein